MSEISINSDDDSVYLNSDEESDVELLREKIQTLDQIQNYVGEYFSKQWVQKNILLFDDDEIKRMDSEIAAAQQEPEDDQGAV